MATVELSDRQRQILRRLVEEYIATGQPVGSKYLVERTGLRVSPSTVRNELAELERLGLLMHPHTSAGRVPTEEGYRLFAQGVLDRLEPRPEDATVQHVEILALQPQVIVAVVITSTGGVTKRVFALGEPIDTGLVSWAAEYLNERTVGLPLGSHGLRQAFAE